MAELETIGPEVVRQVAQITPPSFCVACDAPEGECAHTGARYHDSWFELQTKPGSGKIKPEYEEWFHRNDHGFDSKRPEPEAKPLAHLLVALEPWVDLTPSLERQLSEAYKLEPLKTTKITEVVVKAGEDGFRAPGGILVNRLKEIRSS